MIHTKIPFVLINARLHYQVRSIRCFCLQHGCQPEYHAAHSVLTSGCFMIRQQIWNEILIALAILGKCTMIEQLSVGMRSMYRRISGWHTGDYESFSSLIVTGRCRWHRWRWGWRLCWFGRRCIDAFAPPVCLRILCCDILAMKPAVRKIFKNHSRVSFYRSLHHLVIWKHRTPLVLFLDIGASFVEEILHFLNCGMRKASFGYCGPLQGKAHVGLF